MKCLVIAFIGSFALSSFARTEDTSDGEHAHQEYASPSLRPIDDVPGLPRVLLIGDSISMGYTLPVREDLQGKANVHRPPTNCGSTLTGLKSLDAWLGDGHWDVIHFNFGTHDLKYLSDTRQNVPPDQYEKNLRTLVTRLQKTGATLIFATTTPVPADFKGKFKRVPGDDVRYNEIAVKVMKENNVMIDDLYSFALPKLAQIQNPQDVHFTQAGSKLLAAQVAQSISQALDQRKGDSSAVPPAK
jgi:acyl-CoA thioesterase-1